ncbi:hypothetical protein Droror1_Dr00002305 [Drosera rotundifolia]
MPHKQLTPPKHRRVPRLPPPPKPLSRQPNEHGIVFQTRDQEERYEQLKRRRMQKTRYLDPPTLTTLGLKDGTDALLKGLHMEEFAYSRWSTYERVVLEFLSTLEVITIGKKKEDQVLSIHFCLGGVSYDKSRAWVNGVYNFRVGGPRLEPQEFTRAFGSFWLDLVVLKIVEFRTAKVSTVHNIQFLVCASSFGTYSFRPLHYWGRYSG